MWRVPFTRGRDGGLEGVPLKGGGEEVYRVPLGKEIEHGRGFPYRKRRYRIIGGSIGGGEEGGLLLSISLVLGSFKIL